MTERFAYLNGEFLPISKAHLSPLDRGFLLGDGVYEVIPVYYKKLFHLEPHLHRLQQSLKGIRMNSPLSVSEWESILNTLIEKNQEEHQWVYLQISRGVDPIRTHKIPASCSPTIFATSYPNPLKSKQEQAQGLKTLGVKDIRWKYCHIKTTSRLAYILMYQEAMDAGCDEAIIFHNGFALEGAVSNIFIVRHGVIITPPKSNQLLSGITRDYILSLAEKHKIPYRETKITERDLSKADELWITSSTRGVHPAIEFNGQPVGKGVAGPMWEKMFDLFYESIHP